MKRLLFILLFLCNSPLSGALNLKSLFTQNQLCTVEEKIQHAIVNSDIYSVLKLVNQDVDQINLSHYIILSENSFGRCPKAKAWAKFFGAMKIGLGMALFYKTCDYFRNELGKTDFKPLNRYNNFHTILMDIAGLSGFISSYGSVNRGINDIIPNSKYKSQLLIDLYLKSLVKN